MSFLPNPMEGLLIMQLEKTIATRGSAQSIELCLIRFIALDLAQCRTAESLAL
jgi:hypothetical protein